MYHGNTIIMTRVQYLYFHFISSVMILFVISQIFFKVKIIDKSCFKCVCLKIVFNRSTCSMFYSVSLFGKRFIPLIDIIPDIYIFTGHFYLRLSFSIVYGAKKLYCLCKFTFCIHMPRCIYEYRL